MLIVNCLAVTSPESKPAELLLLAARWVHGSAKEDCVTECATGEFGKKKVTRVPFGAVKLEGLKTKFPLGATFTKTLPAVFAGAEGTAAAVVAAAVVAGGFTPPPYCAATRPNSSEKAMPRVNIVVGEVKDEEVFGECKRTNRAS